jgi:hypothetical protein
MKKTTLFKTSILMLFVVGTAFSQKSIELKYNLKTNDQYNYNTETSQMITIEAEGQEMEMEMAIQMNLVYKILNKPDNAIELDGTIKRIKLAQSFYGMEINYDSDSITTGNPMIEQLNDEFKKVIDQSFKISMDTQGKLSSMDLSLIGDNKEISNNFNSGTSLAIYPTHKVNVGDSWNEDIKPTEESDMEYKVKYTLLNIKGKQATIGIEGVITANTVNNVDLMMDGTVTGEMTVDIETGWLIESLMTQNLTMEIQQEDMTFPATAIGTIRNTSSKI